MATIQYPDLKRDDLVEDLHGYKVPDPFRWLEDTKSEDTRVCSIKRMRVDNSRLLMLKMSFRKSTSLNFHTWKSFAEGGLDSGQSY
jgi:Prolyl oligopeptidase, N-terminal beta-propeller domain